MTLQAILNIVGAPTKNTLCNLQLSKARAHCLWHYSIPLRILILCNVCKDLNVLHILGVPELPARCNISEQHWQCSTGYLDLPALSASLCLSAASPPPSRSSSGHSRLCTSPKSIREGSKAPPSRPVQISQCSHTTASAATQQPLRPHNSHCAHTVAIAPHKCQCT